MERYVEWTKHVIHKQLFTFNESIQPWDHNLFLSKRNGLMPKWQAEMKLLFSLGTPDAASRLHEF